MYYLTDSFCKLRAIFNRYKSIHDDPDKVYIEITKHIDFAFDANLITIAQEEELHSMNNDVYYRRTDRPHPIRSRISRYGDTVFEYTHPDTGEVIEY